MGFNNAAIKRLEAKKILNPSDSTKINKEIQEVKDRADSIKTAQQAAQDSVPIWAKVGNTMHIMLDSFNKKVKKTFNIWTGE